MIFYMETRKKWLLTIVLAVVVLLLPKMIKSSYYLLIVNFALINCIVALGLNFIYGYAGYVSFAQSAFMGIGAYTSVLLTMNHNVPFFISLLCAGLLSSLFGLLLGIPGLKLRGHYLTIITIGFGIIAQLVMMNWTSLTNGVNGIRNIPFPSFGPFKIAGYKNNFYLILIILALFSFISFRLEKSKIGRALMSIREDELSAGACGVNVKFYKVLAFMLSAFYAGIAGCLYAHLLNYISPDTFSYDQSIVIFTMVLSGGAGSVLGPIIGAVSLTFIPEWLRFFKNYYMAIYGVGIVLLMLFMPNGIVGLFSDIKERKVLDKLKKRLFMRKL